MSERDTKFLEFARLVFNEIPPAIEEDSHGVWAEETIQIIARRAYDLVKHALATGHLQERAQGLTRYYLKHYAPMVRIEKEDVFGYLNEEEILKGIPDLKQWPEDV
jgi:hypothetical protein